MATPIQSPAKCEVRSVIWFLNAKGERPAEIHKQIVVVCGNVMNRQNVTKWCREFSEVRTDVHDEQRSGDRPLIFWAPSVRTIFVYIFSVKQLESISARTHHCRIFPWKCIIPTNTCVSCHLCPPRSLHPLRQLQKVVGNAVQSVFIYWRFITCIDCFDLSVRI